jgi:hypothetical protein
MRNVPNICCSLEILFERKLPALLHNYRSAFYRFLMQNQRPNYHEWRANKSLQRSGWTGAILQSRSTQTSFQSSGVIPSSRPLNDRPLGRRHPSFSSSEADLGHRILFSLAVHEHMVYHFIYESTIGLHRYLRAGRLL